MSGLKRSLTREEAFLWRQFRKPTGSYKPSHQKPDLNTPKFSKANTWWHDGYNLEMAHKCDKADHAWVMEAFEVETGRIRDFACLTEKIILETERSEKKYKIKLEEGAYESSHFLVRTDKLWKDNVVEFRMVKDFRHNYFPFAFTISLTSIKNLDHKALGAMIQRMISQAHDLKQEEKFQWTKKRKPM